jgi:hypothetical protein
MFNGHEPNSDTVFIIGVSDPGMDSESGLALAMKRALAVAALTHRPDVSNIRDYFSAISENRFQEAYIEFTRYHATAKINPVNIGILRKFITRYGETIVLAGIPISFLTGEGTAGGSVSLMADLYSHLRRSGGNIDIDEKLDMEIVFNGNDGEREVIASRYTSINKVLTRKTTLNGFVVSDLPSLRLRYTAVSPGRTGGQGTYASGAPALTRYGIQTGNDSTEVVARPAVSLQNGLWHALITGILSALCDAAHGETIHFMQVSDLYDNMPVFLSRELVSVTVPFSIPSMVISDNFLYLGGF